MKMRELLFKANNTNKKTRIDKPRQKNWFIQQYEERNEDPTISLYS